VPALVEIKNFRLEVPSDDAFKPLVEDVSLTIRTGEALGLVGESGSGKTLTGSAIMRLIPPRARTGGSILFDGESVLEMNTKRLRRYRASEVAIIFQDPRVSINPVRRIGDFLVEALVENNKISNREARLRAIALLAEVGIEDGERRLSQFPHELSGGLLQRVMIAAALLVEPRLLIADEPTTALDVLTQSEVISILDRLRRERGLGMLFITHDLDLAASICDRTAVMYAGRIMEVGAAATLHDHPLHPYSAGLIASRPRIEGLVERLPTIPGRPQSAAQAPSGCPFAPRCAHVEDECRTWSPVPLRRRGGALEVTCRRVDELAGHELVRA
jgi:oligopeptide/dipeptide ABC transporter ATP-binding protein